MHLQWVVTLMHETCKTICDLDQNDINQSRDYLELNKAIKGCIVGVLNSQSRSLFNDKQKFIARIARAYI